MDLKAVVRYNGAAMPGDAEKIISNGTSAGGTLCALLGASGNNRDYEPYLAAPGRNDLFAVSAYEWQSNEANDYEKLGIPQDTSFQIQRNA